MDCTYATGDLNNCCDLLKRTEEGGIYVNVGMKEKDVTCSH